MRLAHTKLYKGIKRKGFTKEQMRSIRKQLILAIKNGLGVDVNFQLICAFDWSDSPQGDCYWFNIHNSRFVEAN